MARPESYEHFDDVTRVEVIDSWGRSYICTNAEDVEIETQDDRRTLKIFLKGHQ